MIKDIFIKNLFENKEFFDKTYPYIIQYLNYIDDYSTRTILKEISIYINKYKHNPDYETILYQLQKNNESDECIGYLNKIKNNKKQDKNIDWLIDETEKYFRKEALNKTIMESAEYIMADDNRIHGIPDKIMEALRVELREAKIEEYGSDEELNAQYNYYHTDESRFIFPNWKRMNKALGGGLTRKRILVFVSKPNTGKTMLMVNCDLELLKQGYNVLHITFEDSKEGINERVDGNLLNQNTDNLKYIEKKKYLDNIKKIVDKIKGRLFIREYPATSCNTNHILKLMDELKVKYDFIPDIISVDYLNLMLSKRFKVINNNSYEYIKAIIEELRGLASEKNVAIITAAQFNRGAGTNPSMDDIAESYGIAMTADVMFGIIETDELKAENKQMIKQLRNRMKPIKPDNERWIISLDKDKQKVICESKFESDKLDKENHNVNIPKPISNYDNIESNNYTGFKF